MLTPKRYNKMEKTVQFNGLPLTVIIPDDMNPNVIPNNVYFLYRIKPVKFMRAKGRETMRDARKVILDTLKKHPEGLSKYDLVNITGIYPNLVRKVIEYLNTRGKIWLRMLRGVTYLVYYKDHSTRLRRLERNRMADRATDRVKPDISEEESE